jgi:hypothetical protein
LLSRQALTYGCTLSPGSCRVATPSCLRSEKHVEEDTMVTLTGLIALQNLCANFNAGPGR